MSSRDSGDPLFGGLTRPPTFLGIPIEALLAILGLATVIYLFVAIFEGGIGLKLFTLGLGVVMYGIARLVCANDPRAFRYMALHGKTKARHRVKKYWQAGSYSPLPIRRRK